MIGTMAITVDKLKFRFWGESEWNPTKNKESKGM